MILSFRCEETEKLHRRLPSRKFAQIERVAQRKLAQLNAATELSDMASPPGNRLEALRGDRRGTARRAHQ